MTVPTPSAQTRHRVLGSIAGIFGIATVAASSNVLFGSETNKALAGDVVPFVVWFNFFAGFAYVVAAVGLWRSRCWAYRLAIAIAVATAGAAVVFTVVAFTGAPVEPRTGVALAFRLAVWVVIAWLSSARAKT